MKKKKKKKKNGWDAFSLVRQATIRIKNSRLVRNLLSSLLLVAKFPRLT